VCGLVTSSRVLSAMAAGGGKVKEHLPGRHFGEVTFQTQHSKKLSLTDLVLKTDMRPTETAA